MKRTVGGDERRGKGFVYIMIRDCLHERDKLRCLLPGRDWARKTCTTKIDTVFEMSMCVKLGSPRVSTATPRQAPGCDSVRANSICVDGGGGGGGGLGHNGFAFLWGPSFL